MTPRAAYHNVELWSDMSKWLQLAWIASVVTGGTLLGHAIAYTLEGRSLADGHHAYFAPMLEVVLASVFLGCALIVGRAIASRGLRRMQALPPLLQLWIIVASLQIAGFATIEFLEGSAPNAVGCGIEVLMAFLVAVAIALFCSVVERYAAAILCSYAQRMQSPDASTRRVRFPIDAARSLAICAGVRRFQRPPPLIIG